MVFNVSYFLLWIIKFLLGKMCIILIEILLNRLFDWFDFELFLNDDFELMLNWMLLLLMLIGLLFNLIIGFKLVFVFLLVLVFVVLVVCVDFCNLIVMILLVCSVFLLEYKLFDV